MPTKTFIPHQRILVPVDLGQSSRETLHFVEGLVAEIAARVTLLHVVHLNVTLWERRIDDELRRESERKLRALAKEFFTTLPGLRVRIGAPHEEILLEAGLQKAELIVMGSPRPPRWNRRFHSTTVERVVRGAPCPTLVLPRTWEISPEQYRRAFRDVTLSCGEPR